MYAFMQHKTSPAGWHFPYRLWTFDIKFSLTVENTVFNSQQLFPSCLLIYIIYSLPVLPEIRQYSEYFIFQQDGAPAHRARETVELLKEVTPDFIQPSLWPPNSRLCDMGNHAGEGLQQVLKNFASASWTSGNVLISALSTAQCRSSENDCERVLLLKEDILNMNCNSWCNCNCAL